MRKNKISKKLDLKRIKISKLSAINGGIIMVPIQIYTKANNTRCFSRVATCLCMTIGECDTSQTVCPV